ncbi:four helix bundle protein [Candidatus Bipolaricaulota bacterium]|nr:four helix bundle protein [Candidatus Bipolaricaulota bacterium]
MAGFRDLEVWKRAHELALEVYRLARKFPSDERFRFTDQLCRASTSVPTNIAEGTGRYGKKEFKHFLYIARGSIEETKYLLLLGRELGFIQNKDYERLQGGYETAAKMLNGLINSL